MKRIISIFALMALLTIIAVPLTVQAADAKANSEVVMIMGNTVHLVHRGAGSVKDAIAVNDVLTVYREIGKTPKPQEVGKVKVLSFINEHTFEAEIVKGEIKEGDIAE
jgi:hypothetical protein